MTMAKAEGLLKRAEESVAQYNENFANGEEFDMANFDNLVKEFCETIAVLPQEEAKPFEARLKGLFESLSSLSEDLTEQRNELKAQMQGLDTHSQAHSAYAKSTGYNEPQG